MSQFLKAIEVWRPSALDGRLHLASQSYGEQSVFAMLSTGISFGYDEGLPGVTWAEKRPLLWTDLESSEFLRAETVAKLGIVSGMTLPVFAGEILLAVVTLFFASEDEATGVVELWKNSESDDNELQLEDGFYGSLTRFEWVSRRLSVVRGSGLPGGAWELQRPVVLNDLAENRNFLRARNATEAGVMTGLALPYFDPRGDTQVCTMLSTEKAPIARRFEVWRLEKGSLRFDSGQCSTEVDLKALYRGVRFAKNEDVLGKIWLTGIPLVRDYSAEIDGEQHAALYLPQFVNGRLRAIVVMVL